MNTKLIKYGLLVQFLLLSIVMFAQDPGDGSEGGGLEGDGDTTPAAPIDDYVWVLALVGLLFAFMWFRSIHSNKTKERTIQ